MLDNEEFIIVKFKENDPAKKELKINKWFMFSEMPTTPIHPSYFLTEEQHKKEGGRNQIHTFNSLTNLDQTSPPKNKKDDSHNEKAKNQSFGCKLRILFGYDNGKPCATITSSKE